MNNRNLQDFIIYTPPIKKAQQTAQIIANEMKYTGEIIVDP